MGKHQYKDNKYEINAENFGKRIGKNGTINSRKRGCFNV